VNIRRLFQHHGGVVTPRTTWLFRPNIEGLPREGVLSIEDGALKFAGANGRDWEVGLPEIIRAKRLRASPVLQVSYRRDKERWVAFVYFASPPEQVGAWRGTPISRAERSGRRRAFGFLNERNKDLKAVLLEWVAAIREGAGRA
jgi:hypothetical protein